MDMSSTIGAIEKRAQESIKAEQGDYIGEDGLLVCGKCHTRKQGRYEMPWGIITPMCLCKCAAERRAEEEAKIKRREFEKNVRRLRQAGFPESDMHDWTFANDDRTNEKISSVMENYVKNFDTMHREGKGLLLFGTVGTGKTYAAACVANALIDKGVPVLMTNFARIRNSMQGMFDGRQTYLDNLNQFPLLIIDDLNAESKTEYMKEIVYDVINGRYMAGLPLIVTTNLTSDELKHPADVTNQRTFSRLLEMCLPVEVKGGDRRRERLREDFAEYRDLLGL